MLVYEPGKNAESAPPTRDLLVELQRLRRSGLADLALRPRRYPRLLQIVHSAAADAPAGVMSRLRLNASWFDGVIMRLPSQSLKDAARILFHAGAATTPPPLDDRRRTADPAYTGRSYAREPDTVQRYLERDVLDPLLVEILSSPPGDATDRETDDRRMDYQAWEDDLQRAAVYLARQDFRLGATLLDRWLGRIDRPSLDDVGAYLYGRSLVMMGGLRRDQGHVRGPLSAQAPYRAAKDVFARLHLPRRTAQAELRLAVTVEMSGDLAPAAARYTALADDEQLTDLDRARARLWVGTALTKQGHSTAAIKATSDAARRLELLDEPLEWVVAQQKQALAHLNAGHLDHANRHIILATESIRDESPLQQVRLQVAHAHILLSDGATRDAGIALLNRAEDTATRYSLAHQQSAIDRIGRLSGIPRTR